METVRIEFEPFIGEAARQFIVNGLDMHNIAATGLPDYCPVNFVLRGGRGDVLGGVLGLLWGGWLQVTSLWVAEAARGAGHGTRLLNNAEAYARSRGAVGVALVRLPGPAILRAPRLRGVQRARRVSSRARQVLPAESPCVERRRQITAPSRRPSACQGRLARMHCGFGGQ